MSITEKIKDKIILKIEQGQDKKIDGYYGFYTEITFDENGKFVEQGFYE